MNLQMDIYFLSIIDKFKLSFVQDYFSFITFVK